ncbi:MAG: TraR/DksA family transcriptional regulator [Candidatus Magasanikbacteria bacterium]
MANKSTHSKKFLEEIKKSLLEEQERIQTELEKFTTKNPNVVGDFDATFPEYGDESDDNAREIAQYTVNKPLEVTLEKTLRDIKNSLKSIGAGTYGVCKYCDNQMSERRLLARPTSSACVDCKKTLTQEA